MRENNKRPRIHTVGLGTSAMDAIPPWMRHARAYKVEQAQGDDDREVVTGYARFSGGQGSEDNALIKAVKEVDASITIESHHQNAYKFVYLPKEKSIQVRKLLKKWGYSASNKVDYLMESVRR